MLKHWLRSRVGQILAKRGWILARFAGAAPEAIDSLVADVWHHGTAKVAVIDTDAEVIRVLHRQLPAERVVERSPSQAAGAEAVFIDARLVHQVPVESLGDSRVLVLRTKALRWTNAHLDLAETVSRLAAAGFVWQDVRQAPEAGVLLATSANLYLVFVRPGGLVLSGSPGSERRRAEARVALSRSLAGEPVVRWGGRDVAAYAGGTLNPGSIRDGDGFLLVGRGENACWPVQRQSWSILAKGGVPLFCRLNSKLETVAQEPGTIVGLPRGAQWRPEDFRLFEHGGALYSNHTVMDGSGGAEGPIDHLRIRVFMAISRVDREQSRIEFQGPIQIDRPLGNQEKNWATFSDGEKVHVLYSFSPFRRFVARDFTRLAFTLADEAALKIPGFDDAPAWRNSVNPVPYDEGHWLHVVHRVYPTKNYFFWAVLISRTSLRPVKISSRPIVSGRDSLYSVAYVCSVAADPGHVTLFGGLDDSAIGAWRVSREELDRSWQPIETGAAVSPGAATTTR